MCWPAWPKPATSAKGSSAVAPPASQRRRRSAADVGADEVIAAEPSVLESGVSLTAMLRSRERELSPVERVAAPGPVSSQERERVEVEGVATMALAHGGQHV